MRSLLISTLASVAVAASLSACQQQADEPDTAAESAAPADVTVVDPPDNVTVVKPDTPDVDINPPDVNINPPDVDVNPPGPTTKESTTVTVPGVGSTTTTTEKR